MATADRDWLASRPVAHRGLHDVERGIIENTASAFSAAIARNYAIECDVQISADGEAMVHHDHHLGRLVTGEGALSELRAADLQKLSFKATGDRMLTLRELLDLVSGHTGLLIEMKSRFDGDRRLPLKVAEILSTYEGPAAAMSFDPDQIETFRRAAPDLKRGIVAERQYAHHEWDRLTSAQKRELAFLGHAPRTQPHFVAYRVADLPAFAPLAARHLFGRPLLTWTVRTERDRAVAARWADQMIFEGFRP